MEERTLQTTASKVAFDVYKKADTTTERVPTIIPTTSLAMKTLEIDKKREHVLLKLIKISRKRIVKW